MALFLILLTVPIIEIALFITIGERIGLVPTLATVVVTAIIGASALRSQGFATIQRDQSLSRPEELSDVLIDGMFLFAAGLLLLTPGFLTDTIGFLFLIPPIRRALARWIGRRAVRHVVFTTAGRSTEAAPEDSASAESRGGAEAHVESPRPRASAPNSASPWSHRAPAPKHDEADDAVVLDQSAPGNDNPDRGGA